MEPTDAEAVGLAACGDTGAFMVLVQRYRAPLIAHIHGRLRMRDEAEDVAQDVFCKAWQHLPRLRRPEAFAGWLFRIADNAICTSARRTRPAPRDDDPISPPVGHYSADSSVDIHAAVAALSEDQRTAVSLRFFSGMSTEEVARVLGIPSATVRTRLSRAYTELRRRLAHCVEA